MPYVAKIVLFSFVFKTVDCIGRCVWVKKFEQLIWFSLKALMKRERDLMGFQT